MLVNKKFFPKILSDNELTYFAHLEGVLTSVDELCSLQITKTPDAYNFRIAPSLPKYNNMLLEELFKLHNLFSIHLEVSKSIKTTGTIVFRIKLNHVT